MSNPFDHADGPPPDFADPEAGRLADVIPLRARGAQPTDSGGRERSGRYGAHPAGTKRSPATEPPTSAQPPSATALPAGDRAAADKSRRQRRKESPGAAASAEDREPDASEVARAIVLKQLTGAPRSRKELADTLARRGCDPDVAGEVLDRLEEVGLVDDREFAETYVRSRQATRGLGRRGLAAELRRKGIESQIVSDALEAIDPQDERERAAALVAKKLRAMHGLDATVQSRRLAGMLARKGYPASTAWSVIREAVADAPEHQPD